MTSWRRRCVVAVMLASLASGLANAHASVPTPSAAAAPELPLAVEALFREARASMRRGDADGAAEIYDRALALLDALDPQHPALAEPLNELALWRARRDEPDMAQALLARAQRLLEQQETVDGLAVARILTTRGRVSELLGQDKEARQCYLEAIERYGEARGGDVEVALEEAAARNNLGALLHRKRRFREAEPVFLGALSRLEQVVGKEDLRLLPTLDNLTALYRSQGRGDASAAPARRAVEIRRREQDRWR